MKKDLEAAANAIRAMAENAREKIVTYGGAKIFLTAGWYSRDEVECMRQFFVEQDRALAEAMKASGRAIDAPIPPELRYD